MAFPAAAQTVPGETLNVFAERAPLLRVDGTQAITVVTRSQIEARQPASLPATLVVPTPALVTDGMHGVLIPGESSQHAAWGAPATERQDLIYRVSPSGEVAYKLPLPSYAGPRHDGMVLGEQKTAFAQLVCTATDLASVGSVRFRVIGQDGTEQDVHPPTDRGSIPDPVTKSDYRQLLSP